jgi:hypothetical protein
VTDWEPSTDTEAALGEALRTGDQELYFRILARADLLLPVADDTPGRSSAGWGTWTTGGRTHVLAFTSVEAMRTCLAEHAGSARKVPYHDLAAAWPNQEWWLAINPGLAIEGYLPAWFVAQLARGDVRLPGRTMGARARVEAAAAARARGAAAIPLSELASSTTLSGASLAAGIAGRRAAAAAHAAEQPAPLNRPLGGRRGLLQPSDNGSAGAPSAAAPQPPAPPLVPHRRGEWSPVSPAGPAAPEQPSRYPAGPAAPEQPSRYPGAHTVPASPLRPAPPEFPAREAAQTRDAVPRDQPVRDQQQPLREQAPLDRASRDQAPLDRASREQAPLDRASRDQPARGQAPGDRGRQDPVPLSPLAPPPLPTIPLVPEPPPPLHTIPPANPLPPRNPATGQARAVSEPTVPLPRSLDRPVPAPGQIPPAPPSPLRRPEPLGQRGPVSEPAPPAPTASASVRAPLARGSEPANRPPAERTGRARVPAHAAAPDPAEESAEPDFAPDNDVEANLLSAASEGQTDAFLSTLLLARVLVPVPAGGSASILPGQPGFQWRREQVEGAPFVVVFTSKARLVEYLGAATEWVTVKFVQLIRAWPDESWSFAVNPGTPVGATLPGTQIRALASWAAEVGLSDEPSVAWEHVETRPTPVRQEPERPVAMQKPVAPAQVPYFLDRGYDRVSGFVHRASEAAHLTTLDELYAALGLTYPGSPFKESDDELYLLRWTAYRPNLYRIPYGGRDEAGMRAMQGWVIERPPFRGNGFAPGESSDVIAEFKVDSARLPHGAQMWRLNRGGETLVALLDADGPRWVPVDEGAADAEQDEPAPGGQP